MPGLSTTVDLWRVNLNDTITAVALQSLLNLCAAGSTEYCHYIHRNPNPGPNQGQILQSTVQPTGNLGSLNTSGVDFSVNYKLPQFSFGQFRVGVNSTYLKYFNQITAPGVAGSITYRNAGHFLPFNSAQASVCPDAAGVCLFPRWRAQGFVDWQLGDWTAQWRMRYIGRFQNGGPAGTVQDTAPNGVAGTVYKYGFDDLSRRHAGLRHRAVQHARGCRRQQPVRQAAAVPVRQQHPQRQHGPQHVRPDGSLLLRQGHREVLDLRSKREGRVVFARPSRQGHDVRCHRRKLRPDCRFSNRCCTIGVIRPAWIAERRGRRAEQATSLRVAGSLWRRDSRQRHGFAADILATSPPTGGDLPGQLLQGHRLLNAACRGDGGAVPERGADGRHDVSCAQFVQLECQRQPLAAALCDEAFARGSDSAELRVLAGQVARELGKFDVARAHYLSALAAGVDLDRWYVLGALASSQRYASRDHEDFGRLAAHFRDTGYSARSRATSGLGLAKACDDIGDYALAAAALREANRLLQQASPWSSQAWTHWLNARLRSLPLRAALPADPDFVPIFIVGMPRSGTTLAASRLARHKGVRDRGELNVLHAIAERLQAADGGHDVGALREAASLYRCPRRAG
ncbi:sulfotransferase [Rhodanobacter lindaniclasticus]